MLQATTEKRFPLEELVMEEQRLSPWRPTPQEVEQILLEMRPIIRQFAARARRDIGPRPASAA